MIKKRYLVYAFMAGLLLSGAVCIRVLKAVVVYVDCAKVAEQRDHFVTIAFYHSNTDRYYYVRVPVIDLPNPHGNGSIQGSEVTAKLWSADDSFTTNSLFGESALELTKDVYSNKPEWFVPDDQLRPVKD